jgi:hypothetical protein
VTEADKSICAGLQANPDLVNTLQDILNGDVNFVKMDGELAGLKFVLLYGIYVPAATSIQLAVRQSPSS